MLAVRCMAKEMPSSANAAANSSIARAMEIREQKQDTGKPHGEYQVYSGKEKAEIAKRTAVYGISATIRHYAKMNSVSLHSQLTIVPPKRRNIWQGVEILRGR